ncbi:hypothetical protein ACFYPT_40670 [Streptomyces sp. NPDC005529]|uniref:hypothetical protein n=1 Tax=unclassified Streptomyces TaxID=2593676 RepID=UPI0033B951B6
MEQARPTSSANIRIASLTANNSSLPYGFVPPWERIGSISMAASPSCRWTLLIADTQSRPGWTSSS